MKRFHLEILGRSQAALFPQLAFLAKEGFYLAGGTGLALQLGHRTSVDFDFYIPRHFKASDLYQKIETVFSKRAQKTAQAKDTLYCLVNDVDLSFFWYQYPLVRKLVKIKSVAVASLEDIAAMKMIAISRRPVKRDYIDIFYLLSIFSLEKMFAFVKKKYPQFNQYYSLRALTYFDDIEEKRGKEVRVFDKSFSWEKAKEKIFAETKKYQLAMIKK